MSAGPEEMPASEARAAFADLIGRAQHAGATTYITNHGRRVAAIVPVEAAEALERLEDEALTKAALAALAEGGDRVAHEEILAELGISVDAE